MDYQKMPFRSTNFITLHGLLYSDITRLTYVAIFAFPTTLTITIIIGESIVTDTIITTMFVIAVVFIVLN